ncbi:UNKNOWN [Stylonychia lemnae]|uniref:Uncharacterized protein n=1 Tax=Stylonychia lemnae TaxID=5949 RepID=A0A078A6S1_STYLE|nr:UNKNOWN [Stylonychia lemnae]|eukprot:CDW77586.1 UNKNOWN [Stylonychia lemnae]
MQNWNLLNLINLSVTNPLQKEIFRKLNYPKETYFSQQSIKLKNLIIRQVAPILDIDDYIQDQNVANRIKYKTLIISFTKFINNLKLEQEQQVDLINLAQEAYEIQTQVYKDLILDNAKINLEGQLLFLFFKSQIPSIKTKSLFIQKLKKDESELIGEQKFHEKLLTFEQDFKLSQNLEFVSKPSVTFKSIVHNCLISVDLEKLTSSQEILMPENFLFKDGKYTTINYADQKSGSTNYDLQMTHFQIPNLQNKAAGQSHIQMYGSCYLKRSLDGSNLFESKIFQIYQFQCNAPQKSTKINLFKIYFINPYFVTISNNQIIQVYSFYNTKAIFRLDCKESKIMSLIFNRNNLWLINVQRFNQNEELLAFQTQQFCIFKRR